MMCVGPRDPGAAWRAKRGHVPCLGGSLGPEKVGQPAAADAPELHAAVRVKRYSPTVPAMVGPSRGEGQVDLCGPPAALQ